MDKFGRPLRNGGTVVTNEQVVIPTGFLRLDGSTKMTGNLDLDKNEIISVSKITNKTLKCKFITYL